MKKTYTHLTIFDRQTIEIHLKRGEKQKDIAKILGRSESCISREIDRNGVRKKGTKKRKYYAREAHLKTYQRRWRAKIQSMKINLNAKMKQFIINQIQRIDIETSPKIIAELWNNTQNDKKNHITHTSIYNWLETSRGDKYKEFLLFGNKGYKKRKPKKISNIKGRIGLENRPEEANNRTEKGHYEADLIVSKKGFRGALLTLIDRKTRLPRIIKLKSKKSKKIMTEIIALKDLLGIKSVTFDNGMEFALHQLLNEAGIDTYFSKPYSPWEKGSIENLNRIIRRWFPKKTIFDDISEEKIRSVNYILANTPREILGYLSPYQVHFHS